MRTWLQRLGERSVCWVVQAWERDVFLWSWLLVLEFGCFGWCTCYTCFFLTEQRHQSKRRKERDMTHQNDSVVLETKGKCWEPRATEAAQNSWRQTQTIDLYFEERVRYGRWASGKSASVTYLKYSPVNIFKFKWACVWRMLSIISLTHTNTQTAMSLSSFKAVTLQKCVEDPKFNLPFLWWVKKNPA